MYVRVCACDDVSDYSHYEAHWSDVYVNADSDTVLHVSLGATILQTTARWPMYMYRLTYRILYRFPSMQRCS